MLEVTIPETEFFDPSTEEFVTFKGTTLRLEHSLVSISKWESEWKIPFLSKGQKTYEQTLHYVKCMTINQNVDPLAYSCLTPKNISDINDYISDSRTATTFDDRHQPPGHRDVVTSELIYFWMAQFNIPIDCQKWHLSRLITLLRIASIKNSPEKKMSNRAILSQNAALNAARRKALKTKG